MSLFAGLISFVVLAVVVPVVVRISPRRNAIGIIMAAAMAIHVAGTFAGAFFLAELDYWQSASLYWFATVILIYAYGTCYRSLSVLMLLAVSRNTCADKTRKAFRSDSSFGGLFAIARRKKTRRIAIRYVASG